MENVEITVKFGSISQMFDWARVIAKFPEVENLITDNSSKSLEKVGKTKEEKPEPTEEKKTVLDELKEVGVQLSNADRYEGVQVCLKKYKVEKLKDIPVEQREEVLGLFNKMLKADKTKYAAMLEFLK